MLFTEKKINSGQALASLSAGELLRKNKKRKCYSRKKINSGPALASVSAGERERWPVTTEKKEKGNAIHGKIRKRKCYSRKKINSGPVLSVGTGEFLIS
jgi:hypothetical protein